MNKKKKGRDSVKKMLGLGLFIVLLLGSLGWVYRSHWIAGSISVELAKAGSIDHNVKVNAVFANEEYPIQSPAAGKVKFQGKEAQRFRRGETVAEIYPEGADPGASSAKATAYVSAPNGGLLYQETDGLENMLTPQNLLTMDLSKVLDQKGNSKSQTDVVQAGTALGKMVNNLTPTAAFIELKPTSNLTKGQTIKFNVGGQVQSAKIMRKSDQPQGIVVRFSQYLEGTANHRIQEVSWISQPEVSGVVISKSALYTKGEEQGVLVIQDGIYQFRKVKVIDENETLACVEKLPQGIPVVKNPRSDLEGLTANVKIPS
ncbi:HlyD family efflux transporter periplasmic adaptor subunit [Desulfitobacterium sp. Sab5]|uniref:HlyD family efflux transporter periplasmic adaptor subunit n=1 Tax=Desulfitobacterium nosdiversum TaxID=3375356 RepID=UPI003CF6F25E